MYSNYFFIFYDNFFIFFSNESYKVLLSSLRNDSLKNFLYCSNFLSTFDKACNFYFNSSIFYENYYCVFHSNVYFLYVCKEVINLLHIVFLYSHLNVVVYSNYSSIDCLPIEKVKNVNITNNI